MKVRWTEEKIIVVEQELESMNISVERNDIPNDLKNRIISRIR